MKDNIKPIGLKGYEITERMKELMGITPVDAPIKTSVIELTKLGPDEKVYGIVRENHEYYIKIASKKDSLTSEDFGYIGGLKNKKSEAYPSYAKAIKHLNLKFNSLNEALSKSGQINVFKNDNLITEDSANFYKDGPMFKNEGNLEGHQKSECCGAPVMDGKCSQCGTINEAKDSKNNPWAICTASVGREDKKKYESCVKDVKKEKGIKEEITEAEYDEDTLSEEDQAVQDMMETEDAPDAPKVPVVKEHKLSINRSINQMDSIIDGMDKPNKKKVYTLR